MRHNKFFKFVCALKIYSFWLVVGSAVCKHADNVWRELLPGLIIIACQFHLYCFEIYWVFDDCLIIWHIIFGDGLPKWPNWLVFFQHLNDTLALNLERNFPSFPQFFMVVPCPASLRHSWDEHGVDSKMLIFSVTIFVHISLGEFLKFLSVIFHLIEWQFFDLANHELFLLLDDFAHSGVIDCGMHVALHHRSSFVVFDIAFPSIRAHPAIFAEPLFPKVS